MNETNLDGFELFGKFDLCPACKSLIADNPICGLCGGPKESDNDGAYNNHNYWVCPICLGQLGGLSEEFSFNFVVYRQKHWSFCDNCGDKVIVTTIFIYRSITARKRDLPKPDSELLEPISSASSTLNLLKANRTANILNRGREAAVDPRDRASLVRNRR